MVVESEKGKDEMCRGKVTDFLRGVLLDFCLFDR